MKEKAVGGFFVVGLLVLSTLGMGMGLGFSGRAEDAENGSELVSYVGRCGIDAEDEQFQSEDEGTLYKLEISIEGEGSTVPEEGVHEYFEGEEVSVEAFPDYGWVFTRWEGDHTGTEEEIVITMDENKSLTAHFVEGVELTVEVEGEGNIEVQGEKYGLPYTGYFEEDEDVKLVALPVTGHEFVEWTGDHAEDEEEIVVTMDEEKEITANFEEDPEVIYDWKDLHEIRDDLEGYYILGKDLDEDTDYYDEYASEEANGGKGWQPIGTFTGTFDGQNYTIRGLYINRPDTTEGVGFFEFVDGGARYINERHKQRWGGVGLFGFVDGGSVANVGVVDADLSGYSPLGGLVGWNEGTVNNSYVTGNVSGTNGRIGGLVGWNKDGTVSNSYAKANVSGGSRYVGGLVGHNSGTVESSYAMGDVSGPSRVGGLVGDNWATVNNSYATGDVRADSFYVGGLVGDNAQYSKVNNSHATGDVEGRSEVGGLVGRNGRDKKRGVVRNSYALGNVTGEENVGGLIGYSENAYLLPTLQNSYAGGDVSGARAVGGLVGHIHYSTVKDSYATGDVKGNTTVGGLVGLVGYRGVIEDSYATGNVGGKDEIGGLVGENFEGFVQNSYATGDVDGELKIGGLIGANLQANLYTEVSNSYAVGEVIGNSSVGGLVGENQGTIKNSFWDIETTGQNESDGGTGKTTAEMKDVATFTDLSTKGLDEPWDFVGNPNDDEGDEDVWDIDGIMNDGYPFLSWQVTEEFNLTVNVEGEGTVEVDGEGIEDGETLVYENSTKVDLKAIAEKGWVFEEWTGEIDNVADPESPETTITMYNDYEITANFGEVEEDEHLLTIYVDGEGTTDPEPGTHAYIEGTEVILTAMPDEGHEFVEWTGDYEGTEDEITIVMDDDKEVTAVFEEIQTYELTVEIDGEGEVVVEPERKEYEAGTEVTLTAVPDDDWHFHEWTGDAEETEEEITITMDDDKEVTAHFAIKEHTLTVHMEGEGLVEIDPEQEQYEHGTEVNLTAIPEDGWYFKGWTGDVEGMEEEITITMDDDKEITAVFEEIQTYELTVDIDGKGEVVVEPEREEYEEGTEVTLTAVPDEGWYFIEWTGAHEGTEDELTMIMDSNKEITAWFEEDVEYHELEVNIDGKGTVEVEPEQEDYEEGTEVTLTAVPAEGWYFEEWSGDETTTEVEITVIMDEDKTITAHFQELGPAEFEFSEFSVEPEEPEVGDEVEVSIDVANVGEQKGSYTVEFYLNGELFAEETVEVEAGETKTVTATYEIKEAGEHEIKAEGMSISFTVEEVTTDVWLIVALILSIIALIVFVLMGMQSDEKTVDDPREEEEENDEED